jgi:hypothetical protein
VTVSIPTHAGDDYEALREQLFGIERPGVRVAGYSVLVRCGLAAWARCRHQPPARTRLELGASIAAPAEDEVTRASLARLIAHLILTPKRIPSCQI